MPFFIRVFAGAWGMVLNINFPFVRGFLFVSWSYSKRIGRRRKPGLSRRNEKAASSDPFPDPDPLEFAAPAVPVAMIADLDLIADSDKLVACLHALHPGIDLTALKADLRRWGKN